MMGSLAIKLMFKYNRRKHMKEKLSDITFNIIHSLQKYGPYKLVTLNVIIVTAHSGKIRRNHLNHEKFSEM